MQGYYDCLELYRKLSSLLEEDIEIAEAALKGDISSEYKQLVLKELEMIREDMKKL